MKKKWLKGVFVSAIAAAALYFTPGCSMNSQAVKPVVNNLEQKLEISDAHLQKAFDDGTVSYGYSEKEHKAVLKMKIGDDFYLIGDGCDINRPVLDCHFNGKPDYCAVYYNSKPENRKSLRGEADAEPICGDVYQRARLMFIDDRVEMFKRKLKEAGSGSVFLDDIGPEAVSVGDERSFSYGVADSDKDGVADWMLCTIGTSRLFIEHNTSEEIKERIGDLIDYAKKHYSEKTRGDDGK